MSQVTDPTVPAITPNNDGGTPTNNQEEFTPLTTAQQKHMDEVIRQRMGKAAADVRKENDTLKQRVIELERSATPIIDPADTDPANKNKTKEEEYRRIADQRARDAEQARKEAELARKDAEEARQSAVNVEKRFAVTNAASKQDFIDVTDVVSLTSQFIKHEDGKFIVVNEAGEQRYNLAYQPMSIDEFFADYASKKPHLVRSSARPGMGSTPSQKSGLANGQKYELDKLFGPKSDAGLANRLAKQNPAEYRRLRQSAVEQGLLKR
jgi:hypothetical protein